MSEEVNEKRMKQIIDIFRKEGVDLLYTSLTSEDLCEQIKGSESSDFVDGYNFAVGLVKMASDMLDEKTKE